MCPRTMSRLIVIISEKVSKKSKLIAETFGGVGNSCYLCTRF